jgi:hypothetical protein
MSDFFANPAVIEVVKFERGSQIRRLDTGIFSFCTSLKSLSVPPSVEVFGPCFQGPNPVRIQHVRVESVTFERGSKLREIEPLALNSCTSLTHLLIPASVEKMNANSFPRSRSIQLELEPGNRNFAINDNFLMDFGHRRLILCFCAVSEISIPDEIETIGESCFDSCHSIRSVSFGPNSKLSSIEQQAFFYCTRLGEITLPSATTFLGAECFLGCYGLETVAFRGSILESIPKSAFGRCARLQSIVLPSSVKSLGSGCFSACCTLVNSPWPLNSEIARIGKWAFSQCRALQSIVLPSSVEFVGRFCFLECGSLSSLTFPSPSRLRELLDLPPALSGFVSIPDSVEILKFHRDDRRQLERTLLFGSESRLSKFNTTSLDTMPPMQSFVQVSTGSLKILRRNLEFAGQDIGLDEWETNKMMRKL